MSFHLSEFQDCGRLSRVGRSQFGSLLFRPKMPHSAVQAFWWKPYGRHKVRSTAVEASSVAMPHTAVSIMQLLRIRKSGGLGSLAPGRVESDERHSLIRFTPRQ